MSALTNLTRVLCKQMQTVEDGPEATQPKTPAVSVVDWVQVKVHKRKWSEPRWTGPYVVIECTSHAVCVKGRTAANWHHLTHCVPALPPSRTLSEISTDLKAQADGTKPQISYLATIDFACCSPSGGMERPRPWHPFRLPGLCGLRGIIFCLALATLIIVLPLWWLYLEEPHDPDTLCNTTHTVKRYTRINDIPITLQFIAGVDGTNHFDLCDVIYCDRFQKRHISTNKYLCTFSKYEDAMGMFIGRYCADWSDVVSNIGDSD